MAGAVRPVVAVERCIAAHSDDARAAVAAIVNGADGVQPVAGLAAVELTTQRLDAKPFSAAVGTHRHALRATKGPDAEAIFSRVGNGERGAERRGIREVERDLYAQPGRRRAVALKRAV